MGTPVEVITERTLQEKLAYLEGLKSGIQMAAKLAAIYEGQSDIAKRVQTAGEGMAEVMKVTVVGYPCAVCGYDNTCGEPPGEDCHS